MTARTGINIFLVFPACAVGAFLIGYHLAPLLKWWGIQP